MDTEQRKAQAKRLLIHYFRECMQAAGLNFDQDSRVEIGEITDLIFDEIAEQSAAACTRHQGLEGLRAPSHDWDDPKYAQVGHPARLFKVPR